MQLPGTPTVPWQRMKACVSGAEVSFSMKEGELVVADVGEAGSLLSGGERHEGGDGESGDGGGVHRDAKTICAGAV